MCAQNANILMGIHFNFRRFLTLVKTSILVGFWPFLAIFTVKSAYLWKWGLNRVWVDPRPPIFMWGTHFGPKWYFGNSQQHIGFYAVLTKNLKKSKMLIYLWASDFGFFTIFRDFWSILVYPNTVFIWYRSSSPLDVK